MSKSIDVLPSLKGGDSCKDNCQSSHLSGGFLLLRRTLVRPILHRPTRLAQPLIYFLPRSHRHFLHVRRSHTGNVPGFDDCQRRWFRNLSTFGLYTEAVPLLPCHLATAAYTQAACGILPNPDPKLTCSGRIWLSRFYQAFL